MTTNECTRIEELLSAHQDGATTAAEEAQIAQHLATCAQCQQTAAAFGQIDQQLRRYMQATPVPEIAAPWRNEPLLVPARRGGSLGHWRATMIGLATIFALLFTASILAFRPFANERPQQAGVAAPTFAAQTGGGAASGSEAGQPTVGAAGALVPAAPAAPPTQAAAARSGAVASSNAPASSAAPAASSIPRSTQVPAAAPGAARPNTGSGAAATPAAGSAALPNTINPTQSYRLAEATTLIICQPNTGQCTNQPQPTTERTAIVAILNQPFAVLPPLIATGNDQILTLTFQFANGAQQILGYNYQSQRLTLAEQTDIQAPPELVERLAPLVVVPKP